VLSRPFDNPNKIQQVLIVKLSTWEDYKDPACILNVGDHAFVTRETCVFYRDAHLCPVAFLEKARKDEIIEKWPDVEGISLQRMLEGAILSEFMKPDFKRLIATQNLVDAGFLAAHPIED
jgi:hypothetical protein